MSSSLQHLVQMARQHRPTSRILTDVDEITTIRTLITPEYAQQLLDNNHGNRKVVRIYVDALAREMAEGRWKENGETIIVSNTGRLIDGQNRLMAIVQSGVSIWALIVFGVSDDHQVRATVDQGKARTVANIMQISGVDVHPVAERIASLLAALSPDQPVRMARTTKAEFLADHLDEITPWVEWSERIARLSPITEKSRRRNRSIGASAVGTLAVHMVRSGADIEVFQEFIEGAVQDLSLQSLRGLSQNRLTILQLLNRRLRNGSMLGRPYGGSMLYPVLSEMAVYIRTYNRYLLDDKVEQIKATPGDDLRYLVDLPQPLIGGKQ